MVSSDNVLHGVVSSKFQKSMGRVKIADYTKISTDFANQAKHEKNDATTNNCISSTIQLITMARSLKFVS